jgi:signal peptidase I
MKKIFTWTVTSIAGIAVLMLGLIYVLPGYDLYFVRSDSMKPVFSAGDLIITAVPGSFPAGKVEPGSIVTIQMDKETITHRVVSIKGTALTTKGDANEGNDARNVELSQVVGTYLFKVPGVGYAANFLRTKNGWFLGIVLPTFILLVLIGKDILKEAFRKEGRPAAIPVKNEINAHSKTRRSEPGPSFKNTFYKNAKIRDDPLRGLLREVVKDYRVHE